MPQSPVSLPLSSHAALDVLIVGGGLCGLAVAISVALSGHRATVFEAFDTVHPFGSGLHSSPNGSRLLSRWGLGDILNPGITAPRGYQIRNLDGETLASQERYDEEILHRYQFPLWTLHRVDLQRGLTRRASDLGVQIHYSSRIIGVDSSGPTITIGNGEKRRGDLVVVADGTWSTLRRTVLRQDIVPQPSSNTAYRITVDRGRVQDSDLLAFMNSTQSRLWAGQGSYAFCFPIRGGAQLSLLLITQRNVSATSSAVIEEWRKLAESWDPLLTAIFNAAQRVNKWQVVHGEEPRYRCSTEETAWLINEILIVPPPLTMVSSEATCVLAGDCCHSLHPFLAQGLNLGLEDAATLGQLLSHVTSVNQLPKAVASYDRLRTDRARKILDETCAQVEKVDLPAGEPEKGPHEKSRGNVSRANDLIGSFEHEWVWSYDAYEEAEKAYVNDPF